MVIRDSAAAEITGVFLLAVFLVLGSAGQTVAQGRPSLSSAPPSAVTITPSNRSTGTEQEPDKLFEPQNQPWRKGNDPLTQRDIEWLARDVGYRGARLQSNEPVLPPHPDQQLGEQGGLGKVVGDEIRTQLSEEITGRPQIGYEGQRNMNAVGMRGDAYFRNQLAANGLEYLDHIDNRETGMQATLIKDKAGDGRVYVIFRGTEPDPEFMKDLVRTDLGQWVNGQLAVGKNQYDADRTKLDQWAKDHAGNITATGHSLGAALGQRFIADHPDAVNGATFFNAPAVECDLANRVPRDKLPPISYYLHPRDPASNLGGCQHLYGKVTMVEGGETDNYVPVYGRYVAHSAWMLQKDNTKKKQVDYDQHQADRNIVIARNQMVDAALGKFSTEIDGRLGAVRSQIAAAQVRAQGAAASASNAANAARNYLVGLREHGAKMQGGPEACRTAFMKRHDIEESATKILKYADGVAKGTQVAKTKVAACASKEDVRAGLGTYDTARKLGREAFSARGKLGAARAEMESALDQANGARALLQLAERAVEQIAAETASASAFAKQAREESERSARLRDHLEAQKNALLARADEINKSYLSDRPSEEELMRSRLSQQKMEPLIGRINARETGAANDWTVQAEGQAKQADEVLRQAQASIGRLRGLNFAMCGLVDPVDELIARAENAANSVGAGEVDVELLQKANMCLAKLSPPDALQRSAPVGAAPPPSKDLLEKAKDQIDKDRLAQERERLEREAKLRERERIEREEAERRRIAEERRERELARHRAEQDAYIARQQAEQSAYNPPANPMESLLSGLVQGLQQQQQQPVQRQPQQPPQPAPPQVSRATPETRAPARAPTAAASSGPKYFALVFSAMRTTAPAYQKVPECRFMKHDGPWPMSQAKPGEIEKTLAELRSAGSTGVDVKYFYSEQEAERFKTEWDQRVGVDSNRCLDAQYRVLQQSNPLYQQKGR